MNQSLKHSPMTLIELMVAMSIFIIIIYIVMQVFSGTQVIWRTTSKTSDLFERGRLIINVINEDLQAIVVSDEPDFRISYANSFASGDLRIAFVTSSGLGTEDTQSVLLNEVGYELSDSILRRHMSRPGSANWDFLNTDASTWAQTWDANPAVVSDNVASFNVVLQNAQGAVILTTDTTVMPAFATISFTISPDEQESDSSKWRSFSKVIYLNRGY